jgi:hypothetical protein
MGATLGVVCLIVAAVSTSGGGSKRGATATTTATNAPGVATTAPDSTPPTVVPSVPEVSSVPVVPAPAESGAAHYVLNDSSLRPYSADVLVTPSDGRFFELWSVAGPDSPWVSVQAARGDLPDLAFRNSTRHLVDGVEVIDSADDPTIATVLRQAEPGWWVEVRARGIADTYLVDFASQLSVVGEGEVSDGDGLFTRLRMRQVATGATSDDVLYGELQGESEYLTPDGSTITLRVAAPTGASVAPDRLGYFLGDLATDPSGHVLGRLLGSNTSIVTWFARGARLTLTGAIDKDLLDTYARQAEATGDVDWRGRVFGLRPSLELGSSSINGSGTGSDSATWEAGVQVAHRSDRTLYLWWWTVPGHPDRSSSMVVEDDLAAQTTVDQIVVLGATYVFVAMPSATQTAHVTVQTPDGTEIAVPLTAVRGTNVLAGVVRVDEVGAPRVDVGG